MNPLDVLKYGNTAFREALHDLPMTQWETGGVCGVWSVKDIVAHLASYEHLLAEVLTGFLGGGDTPYLAEIGTVGPLGFNDIEVDKRRSQSAEEIHEEYVIACARSMELAQRLPPDIWRDPGTLPWYGDEYALDDFIVYSFYGHKREHAAQINVFKDSLKATTDAG